jgi:DNA helicase-2/ATP-dependent DNA helicase PcrA
MGTLAVPTGPTLALAGPGTGKTHYLEQLIRQIAVDSPKKRVLALTFSVRAATELRERLREAGLDIERAGAVRTIHSFGHHVLQNHGRHVGREPGFIVYDRDSQLDVIEQLIQRHEIVPHGGGAATTLDVIQRIKDLGVTHDEGGMEYMLTARIRYDKELLRLGAIDYGDMIDLPCRLFAEMPTIRKIYVAAYDYVLIDEFQDTTPGQYRFIKSLFNGENIPMITVADDDQMIYAFNLASSEVMKSFIDDFRPTVVNFAVSRRCPPRILRAAESVVKALKDRQARPSLSSTQPDRGQCIFYHRFATPETEARGVAQVVARLLGQGDKTVGILTRTGYQLEHIERAMASSAIPVQNLGKFSWRDEATLDLAFSILSFTANSNDRVHLGRIVHLAASAQTFRSLLKHAESTGDSVFDLVMRSANADLSTAKGVLESIEKLRGKDSITVTAALPRLLVGAGVAKADDSSIGAFVEYARAILARSPKMSLSELVSSLLAEEFQTLRLSSGTRARVHLTTVHGAKGLEWDYVFVVSLVDDFFPHYRSHESDEEMDGEKRLFYVALTRAKEQLYMSAYARSPTKSGSVRDRDESRFLRLLPQDLVAPWPTD